MRVAFYAPMKPPDHPVPSGDRRMARLLMQALAAAGHEVLLASKLRSWSDGTKPGKASSIRTRGRAIGDHLATLWRRDPPQAWLTYHLYHKAPDWIGPPVTAALGIPYLVAEASYAAKRAHGPWAEGLAASVAAIRHARAVLAYSDVDALGLQEIVEPDRLIRMKPFLDVRPYRAAAGRRDIWRQHWFKDEPGPWLLAVGMMRPGDKARSYAVLADALGRLAHLPWRLAIVGDGLARGETLARFDPARIKFLGQQGGEALEGLYAAADICVWPAINEAYGMALLEAQATGLPVVAGRTGGVPAIVRDGTTGLLTPIGDAAALAAAAATLLSDPLRRTMMGRAALMAVALEHDLAGASAALDAVVKKVLR